jgi:hypothetical protein
VALTRVLQYSWRKPPLTCYRYEREKDKHTHTHTEIDLIFNYRSKILSKCIYIYIYTLGQTYTKKSLIVYLILKFNLAYVILFI